ncbi:hypothetical protein PHYBLDRAFT_169334 [Phycomyces blakesleeanus NRRL 1555(-)]|uniref:Uncharacterized protein n=1 Tax=Phycomyces blakesleeanus (strain ATCC 8743b / DSM 1359 / FGSC 10004 / NBRC 33097 / NRRL 1555) TaxID=763407 RepID=A0A162NCH4_PHYB8|nr:hypothetical protein PHYBLDRAFT_169334 [Phycomyces blakesleeanus NRRL 1555(-)]OAD73078.1 hypothetical protein PHYBLDRAFT_169334 [Phycomyces blakesleeanus NRRL 1555(-)]|eukprot:XP_018291118.1 hypothetical protein PHYBLDRAFT_169334 [Phycomyces blakesleeanus NRRL 1555(-)]
MNREKKQRKKNLLVVFWGRPDNVPNGLVVWVVDEASNPLDRLHIHHLHHTRCQAIPRREKILVHTLNIRKTVDGRKESGHSVDSLGEEFKNKSLPFKNINEL